MKKLIFLPLIIENLEIKQIARGFESIIDNNTINLCSKCFFIFFRRSGWMYTGERERLKSLNHFNFELFITLYIYFSNRSFYILLDVLIFCKYNLISFCQLVKKFRVLFRHFIPESSYVFGYVQILNNHTIN